MRTRCMAVVLWVMVSCSGGGGGPPQPQPPTEGECKTDTDCEDGIACTRDLCVLEAGGKSTCAHVADNSRCGDFEKCISGATYGVTGCVKEVELACIGKEDGDSCQVTLDKCAETGYGECQGGVCKYKKKECEGGRECMSVVCDPKSGKCVESPAPDGTACGHYVGEKCTRAGTCKDGACDTSTVGPVNCDDGIVCTEDVCDPDVGCIHTPRHEQCDDHNPCTKDACDEEFGCLNTAKDGAMCDDGDACTDGDVCKDKVCQGTPKDCDDHNECTADSCQDGQCVHTPLYGDECDDQDPCTEQDMCQAGSCAGKPKDCDDAKACTKDYCDEGECKHDGQAMDGTACDDGDYCTIEDTCVSGACQGAPKNCDDGNPCSKDYCDTGNCIYEPLSGLSCDDSNPCTVDDKCQNEVCKGAPKDCNDNDPCTKDECVAGECLNKPISGPLCDDHDMCTRNDTCVKGKCIPGPKLVCDDHDQCTQDSCDPKKGCVFEPITPCCGNQVVEADEQCDVGPTSTDGCSGCQFQDVSLVGAATARSMDVAWSEDAQAGLAAAVRDAEQSSGSIVSLYRVGGDFSVTHATDIALPSEGGGFFNTVWVSLVPLQSSFLLAVVIGDSDSADLYEISPEGAILKVAKGALKVQSGLFYGSLDMDHMGPVLVYRRDDKCAGSGKWVKSEFAAPVNISETTLTLGNSVTVWNGCNASNDFVMGEVCTTGSHSIATYALAFDSGGTSYVKKYVASWNRSPIGGEVEVGTESETSWPTTTPVCTPTEDGQTFLVISEGRSKDQGFWETYLLLRRFSVTGQPVSSTYLIASWQGSDSSVGLQYAQKALTLYDSSKYGPESLALTGIFYPPVKGDTASILTMYFNKYGQLKGTEEAAVNCQAPVIIASPLGPQQSLMGVRGCWYLWLLAYGNVNLHFIPRP